MKGVGGSLPEKKKNRLNMLLVIYTNIVLFIYRINKLYRKVVIGGALNILNVRQLKVILLPNSHGSRG